MRGFGVFAVAAVLALAACSTSDDGGSSSTVASAPGSAMGPGISVGEALDQGSTQPLLVNGFLFIDTDGKVTLASVMAESLPPIPGGDQVTVEGLDLGGYELSQSQGVRWTDQPVQVLGILDGNTLTVSSTLSG